MFHLVEKGRKMNIKYLEEKLLVEVKAVIFTNSQNGEINKAFGMSNKNDLEKSMTSGIPIKVELVVLSADADKDDEQNFTWFLSESLKEEILNNKATETDLFVKDVVSFFNKELAAFSFENKNEV